jgi:hypothetical protein
MLHVVVVVVDDDDDIVVVQVFMYYSVRMVFRSVISLQVIHIKDKLRSVSGWSQQKYRNSSQQR